MAGFFSLWDVKTRKIINTYASGSDALRVASGLIADFGPEYAADLDLSWTAEDDQSLHIATGAALIALSQGANRSRSLPRRVATRHRRRHVIRVDRRDLIVG